MIRTPSRTIARRYPAIFVTSIIVLASGALSGCATPPETATPNLTLTPTYPDQTDTLSDSVASLSWRDFVKTDTLRTLIDDALVNNADMKTAIAHVDSARAAYAQAQSALYPTVGGAGALTRGRSPADLSITGAAATGSEYQLGASATWEIDLWGRLRSLNAAALETYLATDEARRAVGSSIVAQVANTYLLVRETDERIALAQRTLNTRRESLRIIQRQFEVGAGSKLAVTQAQTAMGQTQSELQALNQAREQYLNALAKLVARPVMINPGEITLEQAADVQELPTGLPSELLLNRPDIRAVEHQLRAADANIAAARAAFFPQVSVTGSGGVAGATLDGLFDSGSGAWAFSPTITVPIFNAGRNQANLDLAAARRNAVVADYERAIQSAFQEVADALAQRHWIVQRIQTTKETQAVLSERLRLAELRYQSGRSAYLEVLDSERDLFATEQLLVQLRRSYLSSSVNLYVALGGGFADESTLS